MNRHFGGAYRLQLTAATCSRWFLARGYLYPEDGDDMFLQNVSSFHRIYTAPHPRRWHSSRKYISDTSIYPPDLNPSQLRRWWPDLILAVMGLRYKQCGTWSAGPC
jgi:hypothetical protein